MMGDLDSADLSAKFLDDGHSRQVGQVSATRRSAAIIIQRRGDSEELWTRGAAGSVKTYPWGSLKVTVA